MSDCFPCGLNVREPSTLPSRERVYDDEHWRVAHAFNSALPGWMVIIARRHIMSLSELTTAETVALGPLLRDLSAALEEIFEARKAYVFFLAEAERFAHLHIHVVPRRADLPYERRAVRVFGYLDQPETDWVTPGEMDRIADTLRPLLMAGR